MKRLASVGLILAAAAAFMAPQAAAQARGIVGVGLGVPVGDFADEAGAAAQSGGGTVLAGLEWLPRGRSFGLRVDGAYNRFCTSACDEAAGELDVRYRFLNANVNGLVEFPVGNADLRPYLIAGVGIYNYKLEGDDAPALADESETDFGLNGGLGMTYTIGRVGIFAEGRFHNVFATGSDLQYIPVMLGARINLQ
ncbi:MAG TPA: outer membrane beta-barrel protein [Gemmatimonadales bacterium]